MNYAALQRQCSDIRIVEVNVPNLQSVNDTLSISNSEGCFSDITRCPKDSSKPNGHAVNSKCASPCSLVIPANTSVSMMKMYRMPSELAVSPKVQMTLPPSYDRKMFLEPSMPFKIAYNGKTHTIDKMVLYHPCPVRIENVQYDAVLQLGETRLTSDGKDDLVVLIPLAGSNRVSEGGALFQKLAPFITGLADTAIGNTAATGGTTVDATNPEQEKRCETIQKERDKRWNITLSASLDKFKREVIRLAREDGSRMFNRRSEGGTGELERWAWRYNGGQPQYLKDLIAKNGPSIIWTDDAYVWDAFEAVPGKVATWGGRFNNGPRWDRANDLINRIRKEKQRLIDTPSASEQREQKKQEAEFLRLVETGVPDPTEPLTPCEIMNVALGQDWSITKLIPVGGGSIVKGSFYAWKSAKVRYQGRESNPTSCVMQYGTVPTNNFTQFIVIDKPVYISSADLRSIRSLPPVSPENAGIRFVNTKVITYRTGIPDNCKDCPAALQDAGKLQKQIREGKIDKALFAKVVFSFLGALALFIGVYFGLKWALGTKGELFKNLGVKIGSYLKSVKESRPTALPKSVTSVAAMFPTEKSKVSDIVPSAINAAPQNLPAEVYRAPATTAMISGPRKRSLVSRTIPQ
jgi:hypothetical protein